LSNTLPTLNFYANHTLDFVNTDIDQLKYQTIFELRKIPIPDEVLQIAHISLLSQFPDGDLSKFESIENWCPLEYPYIPSIQKVVKIHIVAIGQMGMRIVFTPQHIILPSIIYERIAWYSPSNKEKVQAIRSYYCTIINHFGGDHALYVDTRIHNKYPFPPSSSGSLTLSAFEQALIERYGTTKKTLFDYPHGKYPKYYIDKFE
jgi:hypothetical protein